MAASLVRAMRDLFTAVHAIGFSTYTTEPRWQGTICLSWVGRYDDEGFHGPRAGVSLNIGRRGYAVIWS